MSSPSPPFAIPGLVLVELTSKTLSASLSCRPPRSACSERYVRENVIAVAAFSSLVLSFPAGVGKACAIRFRSPSAYPFRHSRILKTSS